ncbi:hypothetical protein SAY87_011311 [Trapa incisa]|uniref:UspA domain-containing protein n=1 Tax=Trapa incisa TaxID=236973 RepID=A0AAN7JI82_9MYRT|nr:hypothetical protein SAY87_011311 [Trapa incisa]
MALQGPHFHQCMIIQKAREKRRAWYGEKEDFLAMETLKEDEVYNWTDVRLPSPIAAVTEERQAGERRNGRDIIVAVDHGPKSKHAFDWALIHLCRANDTLHLVHAVSSLGNKIVYDQGQGLMEKLAAEAVQVAMVRTAARIVEGEAGSVICKEAERIKPAAVVIGTRGRGLIRSVIQGSVSEYCFRHCKVAPIIIVPGKGAGDES